MTSNRWRSASPRAAIALFAAFSFSTAFASPTELPLYEKRPLASWHVAVADFESSEILKGASAAIEKPNSPGGTASVKSSQNALTLQWKGAWYAGLRIEGGKPVDLRPYGILALDLKVEDLSKGGISFKINCGKNCERQVPYLIPARSMEGKGWKKLRFPMSCFVREGDDFSAVPQPFALEATGTGQVAIANVKFLKTGKANASCPDYKTVSVTPDMLNEAWSIDWWLPRHQKKLDDVKRMNANNEKPEIVFIGDSITEGWEKDGKNVFEANFKKHNALALGFGGDRTENVLWRLQHGAVDGIAPKVAVLMFGTNNTGHRLEDPRTTAAGIKRNIDELRQRLPNTKILLLAIFPRGEKPGDHMRRINDGVNAIIANYADNKNIFYLDINKAFLDADGVLPKAVMPDLLHPNENGYQIWAREMAPTLQRLLKEPARTAYTWDNVAIGGGGFVSAVIPSKSEPGLVYARTDVGGAYRWDKTSARWQPLLDWVSDEQTGYLGVDSLAMDPKDPAKVYLLAGISYQNGGKTAILRSSDYGKTFAVTDVSAQFKTHGNGMGRQNGERLVVDPGSSNILYVGTRQNGLFKSVDSGQTWKRVAALDITTTPNKVGIGFVMLDPASVAGGVAKRLYVAISRYGAVGPSLYRSDDAGATFTAVAGAPTALMPQRAAMDRNGNLLITYANGAGPHGHVLQPELMDKGQIWKYSAGNGAWTNITPAGFTTPFAGISVDPKNPERIIASTINTYLQQGDSWGDRIFLSADGGGSWTDVVARGFAKDRAGVSWIQGNAIHWAGSIEFDPFDTKSVLVSSGNGIFRTSNIDAIPATWTFHAKGLEETVPLNLVSIPGGPVVSVIGDYDGFLHTDMTQYSPIHTPTMGTTFGLDVAALNTSAMVRSGPAMYTTRDRGASWQRTAAMNGIKGQVAMSADGATILHSPEKSTTSYRSVDSGASWTAIAGLNTANIRPVADPVNASKFYVYNKGALMVSTDGGASFATKATLANGGSRVIRAAPGREGDIWVPLHGGGLGRSTNSGASFSLLPGVSYGGAVGFGKADAGAAYPTIYIWGSVDGVRGVHRSTDIGASWVRINDDAHQYGGPGDGQFVVGDMNTFGVVYMSTAGRGIVYGKPSGT